MIDDTAKLLAAIEAMHAEVREMRKELLSERVVREQLDALREAGRLRSQKWRNRNVTQRHRNVAREVVKDQDLDQVQVQDLILPAKRHRDVGNVTQATRDAYSVAYEKRHGAKPVWNATTNAQMARFVRRIGREEAPGVAEFYVGHKSAWYVQQLHPVSMLLRDAEKLHTEWITGRQVTATKANQEERTQDNVQGWESLRRRPNGVVGP